MGEGAFRSAYNLRHVNVSPDDAVINPRAFLRCYLLEVLAAAVGFELDTGDRWGSYNNATIGITRFVKWRNHMDDNKEPYTYKTTFAI